MTLVNGAWRMAHGHWSLALRSKVITLAMSRRRITRPSGPPYSIDT